MNHDSNHQGPNWSRINQWLLWLGLAAAVAWLVIGHGAHLLQIAPFLLLLACPLMHLFGHGGHGSHGRQGDEQESPTRRTETPKQDSQGHDGHLH